MTEYSRLDARLLPAFENAIPESLRRRLAKEKNMAAVGAVWDGTPCGVSVVELKYGGALLELAYLFVPEEYRGRGVGSGMVRFLCECAERMDAPLRCLFTAAGKSDPLYGFFADLPDFYVSEETGAVCRIPISGLTTSGELMAAEERCKNAVPFFSLPAHDQKNFRRSLEARGIYYLEHMDGLDFEEELCLCAAGAGGPRRGRACASLHLVRFRPSGPAVFPFGEGRPQAGGARTGRLAVCGRGGTQGRTGAGAAVSPLRSGPALL